MWPNLKALQVTSVLQSIQSLHLTQDFLSVLSKFSVVQIGIQVSVLETMDTSLWFSC